MKKKIIIGIIIFIVLVPLVIYLGFPGVLYNLSVNKAREKAGLVKKSIQIDGHEVVYLEGGKGETIVLLHGLGGDKDNWAAFAQPITGSYHVIALDMPGSGESSKVPEAVYSIHAQVKRLQKIIKALNINKFHLVGHAMGGEIAGMYAALNPGKVLSLAFFSTLGITSPEPSEHSKLMAKGKNMLAPDTVEEFDDLLKFMFIEPPSIPGSVKKFLLKKAIAARDYNTKIFFDVYGEDYSLESDLGKLKMKALLLWGDQDNIAHVSSVRVLERGLSNSKTIIIKGAGHVPMRQKPQDTAKYYLDFIKG